MKKVGLFGGSFNPIHNGHIAVAKAILAQCRLDEVWLMVSPQNPLKRNLNLLDDHRRLQLAQLALEGEPDIKVSDYEFHLPKPSYTWNTLQHLKADYPDHTFVLIIGGDNWERFPLWYQSEEIIRNHRIVVYPRSGSYLDLAKLPAGVSVVETPLVDISSTEIRERIRKGQDISDDVPESIESLVYSFYSE